MVCQNRGAALAAILAIAASVFGLITGLLPRQLPYATSTRRTPSLCRRFLSLLVPRANATPPRHAIAAGRPLEKVLRRRFLPTARRSLSLELLFAYPLS